MALSNKVINKRCQKLITRIISSAIEEKDALYFKSDVFLTHCKALGVEPYEVFEDLRYRKIFSKNT